MNLYADPLTALTVARYHQEVIREAFPRRRRRRHPVEVTSRVPLTVVATEPSVEATVSHPDSTAA